MHYGRHLFISERRNTVTTTTLRFSHLGNKKSFNLPKYKTQTRLSSAVWTFSDIVQKGGEG